jgi:hypothetical protein
MESKNGAGKIVGQLKGPRRKVFLGNGVARIDAAIPYIERPMYAVQIIFGALSPPNLTVNSVTVEPFNLGRRNAAVATVTGLPFWPAKQAADMVATFLPVIASMGVNYESIRRARVKPHRH